MLTTNTRSLAAVVVLLGLVAFYLSPEGILSISEPSRPGNRNAAKQTPPVAPNRVEPAGAVAGSVAPGARAPSDAQTSTPVAQAVINAPTNQVSASHTANAPVQLQVQVPSDVQVGEVFQAQVHVRANVAVRQLVFAIAYDKSRLALVGSSAGNFAEQAGASAEFGAEEPSDGNIQISLNARTGPSMTGAGNLALLQFEAIKRGRSPIVLQNLTMFDGASAVDATGTVLHEGRVTIH
jgi:hypothetical protein